MGELFNEENEKEGIVEEEEISDPEDILEDSAEPDFSDARRRLEKLLDEKRLRDELDDFVDY